MFTSQIKSNKSCSKHLFHFILDKTRLDAFEMKGLREILWTNQSRFSWSQRQDSYRTRTLSFRSQRNLSFCGFLCMKTPSSSPLSTDRISMALWPQPITWPVPMYASNTHTAPVYSVQYTGPLSLLSHVVWPLIGSRWPCDPSPSHDPYRCMLATHTHTRAAPMHA